MSSITVLHYLTQTNDRRTLFWGILGVEGDTKMVYNFWGKTGRELRMARYAQPIRYRSVVGGAVVPLIPRLLTGPLHGRLARGWSRMNTNLELHEPDLFTSLETKLVIDRIASTIPLLPRPRKVLRRR